MTKTATFTTAWTIARQAAAKFGGKARAFFAEALRMTYRGETLTTAPRTLADLAADLKALPGVAAATAWTTVPGKERIYVDLVGRNGTKKGRILHVVAATGALVVGDWAGRATYDLHETLGTMDAIKAIVAA